MILQRRTENFVKTSNNSSVVDREAVLANHDGQSDEVIEVREVHNKYSLWYSER
jgi:hypothetical protein